MRQSQPHIKSRFSYHLKGLFLEKSDPVLESRGLFLSDQHGSLVASWVFMEAISAGRPPVPHPIPLALVTCRSKVTAWLLCWGCPWAQHMGTLLYLQRIFPKIADTLPGTCPAIQKRVAPSLRRRPQAAGFHTFEFSICSSLRSWRMESVSYKQGVGDTERPPCPGAPPFRSVSGPS